MASGMSFKAWLTNGYYYTRFNWYALLTNRFKNPPKNSVGKEGYQLVFSDEFDAPINWEKWWWCEHWGNKREKVIYKSEQVKTSEGNLLLTSDLNTVAGEPPVKTGGVYTWKSFNQKGGYFELRAKVPKGGVTFWPAFWLESIDVWPPEIDVFELMGQDSGCFTMTLHWYDDDKNAKQIDEVFQQVLHLYGYRPKNINDAINFLKNPWSQERQALIDQLLKLRVNEMQGRRLTFPEKDFLANDFHTWAISWESDKITWYFDNLEVYVLDEHLPDVNLYILITNNYTTDPPQKKDLPTSLCSDYFRAYKKQ